MRRRMSKQVLDAQDEPRLLSEYIAQPEHLAHFLMRWVPLPPDVRRRIFKDHKDGGTLTEVVDMSIGCPHCHEDVTFRYDLESPDPGLLRRLINVVDEIGSVEFSIGSLLMGSRSEVARKLIDVATELKEALRRW